MRQKICKGLVDVEEVIPFRLFALARGRHSSFLSSQSAHESRLEDVTKDSRRKEAG
jgi:hypothetical protein